MEQSTTFIGDLEVIASGTAIGPAKAAVRAKISDLTLTIIFKEGPTQKIVAKQVDDHHVEVTATGFASSLGTTWQSPVGALNKRQLYFAMTVYQLGEFADGSRTVHYSWMLGEAVGVFVFSFFDIARHKQKGRPGGRPISTHNDIKVRRI